MDVALATDGSMLRNIIVLAIALAAAMPSAGEPASTAQDLEPLRRKFSAAWALHDGHALAQLMADDVDFVKIKPLPGSMVGPISNLITLVYLKAVSRMPP